MTPITVRQRLQDYEFTDEQEMTLTIELLNRIEKDIDELKAAKTRDGFTLYVAIGGIAAVLYILLGELNKLSEVSFSAVGVIFFALILLLKIPWAIYQLIALDRVTKKQHKPGRFFWSNDFFFEHRPTGVFQILLFLLSLVFIFFIPLPRWVAAFTGMSFLLYILIIVLILVLSLRRDAYVPNSSDKRAMAGLPILYIVFTAVSVVGLISQMKVPIGAETQSYVLAGLLLAVVFFIDTLIRLTTPSLLLEKLQTLRNDIIFLRANLEDAWTRYEVCIDGHEMSEELRTDMDDIIRYFNTLDFHQAQQTEALSAVQEELKQLQTQQGLTEGGFKNLDLHKIKYIIHRNEVTRIFNYLNPRLNHLAQEINKISGATQQWQRADEHHQSILSRLSKITEKDQQLAQQGKEADDTLEKLRPKHISQGRDETP